MNEPSSDKPQQWSVHAEFTISHPGANDPRNPPRTGTIQDENGVRMLYTWSADDKITAVNNPWGSTVNTIPTPWSSAATPSYPPSVSSPRALQEPDRLYGFQKGNLFFTSVPPKRNPFVNIDGRMGVNVLNPNRLDPNVGNNSRLGVNPGSNNRLCVNDSGYGSELFASNVLAGRKIEDQAYARKCRSTCSIVLSNDPKTSTQRSQCGRTQSLRCQTPSVCSDSKSDSFYGCGDPWCHHLPYGDDFSTVHRISPVKEVCEENTLPNCTCPVCDPDYNTKHYQTSQQPAVKRDVSVQTLEMVNKCTSPLLKMEDLDKSKTFSERSTGRSKLKRGNTISGSQNRRQTLIQKFQQKSDSLNSSQQSMPKLSRSPTLRDIPSLPKDQKGSSSDSTKKPRTIHIDVYCTGTDLEVNSDSTSSESEETKSASTPQTVFESQKLSVTHKKANPTSVPYILKQKLLQAESKSENTSLEKESDDETSTGYPSKVSSYSNMGYSLSSISSFQTSATPFSMSSCTFPDLDNDSVACTSWKDTFSDIDSIRQSRSSVAPNDSVYFVPKKIEEENESIADSTKVGTETTESVNLHPSDSFEYANSEDKLRIMRMEKMWKNKSPWTKRKLFSQFKQLQEPVNKRLSQVSKDSDSEHSDEEAQGWTFVKKENNVPQQQSSNENLGIKSLGIDASSTISSSTDTLQTVQSRHSKVDIINDNASRSASKSPSSLILLQRLKFDPNLGSPFTISPGHYTEQRYIAKRFGPVVNVFRKPGHHIGPAKNPHCVCDHCKRHFENLGYRNRTGSMIDTPDNTERRKLVRRSSSEDKKIFDKRFTTNF